MYVVRRPFRNAGHMMLPGSIVEPGDIKLFKARMRDRVIIEVGEHNLDEYDKYFTEKFGVSIKPETEPEQEPEQEPKLDPKQEPKPTGEAPKARVVVKAN